MFCTTECWNCEDKNCEYYFSKQDLYFENQSLIEKLRKISDLINSFEKHDNVVYNLCNDILNIINNS